MDQYAYLLIGLLLLVPLLAILSARRDLAKKALLVGLMGGIAAWLTEPFFMRDYWRPPSPFGAVSLPVEDILFGFTITALSFAVYACVRNVSLAPSQHQKRYWLYGLFFLISVAAMLVCNVWLGVNSIVVSYVVFVFWTMCILCIRPDLLKVAAYSTTLIMIVVILIYLVLFDVIAPHFWDTYWLLAGTRWGITVLGNLPLTELVWYATWSAFASISYPFVSGKVLSARNEQPHTSP